jgi:precorrin-3B synthase
MNAFSRRGACPALSAPMQTGDGLLVRLNPVSGGLFPKSLIGLAESALRHGNGIMEVTARGSLQIRGLTAKSAALLATEVDALGIAARTGLPVETGPLAGIDRQEIADPRPLAERIRAAVEEAGLTQRLGPKVSVIVDGGGQLTLDAVTADVRLVATRIGAGVQWRVSIAGDAGGATWLAVINEEAGCDAVVAILKAIAEKGREAHARDLMAEDLDSSQFRGPHSVAPPSVLPDISPARGEIGSFGAGSPSAALEIGESGNECAISPLVGEMSGRTEGGAKERFPFKPSEPIPSPIGVFAVTGDTTAPGIGLPYGSMPADKIISLAQSALALGATEIRLAPGRALLFLGQPKAACMTLQQTAATLGFITDPADPRTRIAACPGTPACASGQIATRDIAETVAVENGDILDSSLTLHISGCAKGCAHPGKAALTRPPRGRRRKRSRTCRERDGKGPSCRLQAAL